MKDKLISFETAKLAKEKGFNIYQDYQYVDNENTDFKSSFYRHNDYQCTLIKKLYFAPTQSLLQRWLREVHNIIVEVQFYSYNNWNYSIYLNEPITEVTPKFKTYEEALEEGLQEALKLIKPKPTKL